MRKESGNKFISCVMVESEYSGSTVRELGNEIAVFKCGFEFFFDELTVRNSSRDYYK